MEPEKISKLLDTLKNRFSSRLIIYFLIYWLIYNWQITVSLLWYDKSQIKASGFNSIFEFISNQLSKDGVWFKLWFIAPINNSCKPLLYAIVSTIFFPILKSGILSFDAFIIVKRNNFISKIKKDELFEENLKLKKQISSVSDSSILNGYWELIEFKESTYDSENGVKRQIYIKDNTWYDLLNDKMEEGFTIIDFYFHPTNLLLVFTKILKSDVKIKYRYRLSLNGNEQNQKLEGFENDKIKVIFNKISN
ncbi:hypothetical protein [Flavobacterium aciduliphilum]|uniref:Uncharacterized protein n=1 Tax=Flavobacterium aciduliphilum TaxID=1101402 RepID=A0A328YNR7_9FLAO|nr:hypothetical protein [Flavobacterium aciduliphilum]RAR75691.1 hypothetical protein CLV55_101391 [Flavobacterium aciduliphilum]